jgi:hypothetical protein
MADPFDKYLTPTSTNTPPSNSEEEDIKKKDPFAKYLAPTPQTQDPFAAYIEPKAPANSVDTELQDRSFFDKPVLGAEYTKREELAQIAKKHGVPAAELERLAPYFGARMEGSGFFSPEEVKRSVGGVGSLALGIPQKLYKKTQSPEMEAALDDLQNLASGRSSYAQLVGEVAVPGMGLAGKAATTTGKVAIGAGTGAVAGYAGSSKQNEVQSTIFGAGVGGAASALAAKLANKSASKLEKELEQKVLQKEVSAGLDDGAEQLLKERASSEQDIQKIFEGTQELDSNSVNRIVKEQIDPDFLERAMSPDTLEGKLIRNKIERTKGDLVQKEGLATAIRTQLAEDLVESRALRFAAEVTGESPKGLEEAREAVSKVAAREGEEAIQTKYKLQQQEKAALDYIDQKAIRLGRGMNFVDKAINLISDAQFVMRDIDQRAGTKLESILTSMSNASNRMTFAKNDAAQKLDAIFKQNKGIDKAITDSDKLYRAMDTGNMSGLSEQELRAVGQFRQLFDDGIQYVNGLVKQKDPTIAPLSIPKRENYVPHLLKDTSELITDVSRRINVIKQEVASNFGREIKDLAELTKQEFKQLEGTQAFEELKQAVLTFNPKAQIRSGADLSSNLKDTFSSKDGRLRMETIARASLERQGDMPDWMREKNLYKLANTWYNNTLKHLYLRKDMDAMRSVATRLDRAGADLEAEYVRNLLSDVIGVRKGTFAERVRQGELSFQTALDRLAEKYPNSKFAQGAIAGAKAIPTVLGDLNRQIYPNLLGLSPRALIMNATQTIAKTAPELGNKYGYTTLMRGAIYSVLNAKSIPKMLESEGYVPAQFIRKYSRAVQEGIARNSTYAIPQQVLQGMGDAAMYLYTKMDTVNRAITRGTAEVMANDLAGGVKLAQQSLSRFPASVQKQVAQATDKQQVANILGSYLNASTQYNYNRISMSEFGRTMGPFFSTFSKWPTATAGDIIQEYRQKGLLKGSLRNAEKYVAPLMLFQMADYLLYGNDPEQMTDRQKKLLGVGGLSQAAPIGSAGAILKGDFFTPPAVDAVVQTFVVPAMEGDPAKLQKGFASAVQNFTPGSVYVRLLTDDIPTLVTGERPEGSDFLERAATSIDKMGR